MHDLVQKFVNNEIGIDIRGISKEDKKDLHEILTNAGCRTRNTDNIYNYLNRVCDVWDILFNESNGFIDACMIDGAYRLVKAYVSAEEFISETDSIEIDENEIESLLE